ncbi:unnamed protein product [Cladocopium goreaui]|uniref:5-formyltetrahydrofolate cyclo-ligase-like protein n=1 Tax=Cladocopium goreaui TaxID=2562237 RepID=A0A9P1GBQ1_9DINO|nr:unnamed protein product [Cladocopium goreaui]
MRLEAEQRCVEAELQLAIALSRHLEKRLQLIEALNEVLEMAVPALVALGVGLSLSSAQQHDRTILTILIL